MPPLILESEEDAPAYGLHSYIPSLEELIAEKEHEVSIRRRRARRKRAADNASKLRRSIRLAAKENPFYEDTTSKASRVQAAKLDLTKASSTMVSALEASGILKCPRWRASPRLSCVALLVSVALTSQSMPALVSPLVCDVSSETLAASLSP